jgi:hypothetical protein
MLKQIRRASLAAVVALVATAGNLAAQDGPSPIGDWEGVLSVPEASVELTVVFHITQAEEGAYAATHDSPDQGAFGIPCEAPSLEGALLKIPVAAVQGGFEGTIADDGSQIEGTWSQGPNSLALVLTPVTADEDG